MDDFLPPPNGFILRRSTGAVTYRCCNAVKDVPKERLGEYQSSTSISLMIRHKEAKVILMSIIEFIQATKVSHRTIL